jgi:signal transduction histidine kinase
MSMDEQKDPGAGATAAAADLHTLLILGAADMAEPARAALQQAGFAVTVAPARPEGAPVPWAADAPPDMILFSLESAQDLTMLRVLTSTAGPIVLALVPPGATGLAAAALARGAADYIVRTADYAALLPFHLQRAMQARARETAQGAMHLRLAALEEEARQREANLRRYMHDLRTPLSFLVGYSELLLMRDQSPETVKQMAGEIYREAEKLSALMDHWQEQPLALAEGW